MRRRFGLAVLVVSVWSCVSWETAPIVDSRGKPVPGAIAELSAVDLNGVRQFVLLRGRDRNLPILLRVHGGPGQAEMAAEVLNRDLEETFLVVEWDQRGAGKSAVPSRDYSGLTLAQTVDDAVALAEYLHQRFGRKVLLLGHSWGSLVGLLAVEKAPQWFLGFASTGQIVNYRAGMALTYEAMDRELDRRQNGELRRQYASLGGPPPYPEASRRQTYFGLIESLGFSWHRSEPLDRVGLMVRAPEYSWAEKLAFTGEAGRSFEALLPDLLATDLNSHRQFAVPLVFFLGAWDRLAPPELAEAYEGRLEAPKKDLVRFENSAHFPQYEEPARFASELRRWAREIGALPTVSDPPPGP